MSAFNFYMAASASQTPAASADENNRIVPAPTPISNSTATDTSAVTNNSPVTNKSTSINNSTASNKHKSNKRNKRYYCSHEDCGYNNTHDTEHCTWPEQKKAVRQIFYDVAKEQLGITEDPKHMEKSLAILSNEELKEGMEELEKKMERLRKEMKRRGVR